MTNNGEKKLTGIPPCYRCGASPCTCADGITLIHADCREVLPMIEAGSVEITLTSPPYNTLPTAHKPSGLHGERKSGVNRWIEKAANSYHDSMDEKVYQMWLREIMEECRRVSRGLVWLNHKIRYRGGEAIHPARLFPWPDGRLAV